MVITSKEYNRIDIQKWNKKVDEWRKNNDNNYIPQIAFYGFRSRNGNLKNYGFVACGDNWARWFKAKKNRGHFSKKLHR